MPSRHRTPPPERGLIRACPHQSGPSLACPNTGNKHLDKHRSVVRALDIELVSGQAAAPVTVDRLSAQHPAVAAAIEGLPIERLGDVVRVVAFAAARSCSVDEECRSAENPSALVASLDEFAWAAQERGDDVRFEAAFRRARAAEAWSRSMGPIDRESAAEALYEAVHAFGGGAQAEAIVTRLIHA